MQAQVLVEGGGGGQCIEVNEGGGLTREEDVKDVSEVRGGQGRAGEGRGGRKHRSQWVRFHIAAPPTHLAVRSGVADAHAP